MDRNELRNDLQGFIDRLRALEERARKLQNQNLADVAASAHGKVRQLIDHPDLHLAADTQKDQSVKPDGTPRGDRPWDNSNVTGRDIHQREHGNSADWVGLSQAERDQYEQRAKSERQSRQQSANGKPDQTGNKAETFRPGDPQFQQSNRDFRDPNDVELNKDGTLRQAPNAFGSARDVREG